MKSCESLAITFLDRVRDAIAPSTCQAFVEPIGRVHRGAVRARAIDRPARCFAPSMALQEDPGDAQVLFVGDRTTEGAPLPLIGELLVLRH